MAKKELDVIIMPVTVGGAYQYGSAKALRGKATFTQTFSTCHFGNMTFKKIKGGSRGGSYKCVQNREIYRIIQKQAEE